MSKSSYEIRVVGTLGPAARAAFADLFVDVEPTSTVLCGDLEQEDLHETLERIRSLGLELIGVTHTAGAPPAREKSSISDEG